MCGAYERRYLHFRYDRNRYKRRPCWRRSLGDRNANSDFGSTVSTGAPSPAPDLRTVARYIFACFCSATPAGETACAKQGSYERKMNSVRML